MADTYVCRECSPTHPCVCPDADDPPTRCPIYEFDGDPSAWVKSTDDPGPLPGLSVHAHGAKNRFGHDDDSNTCPFCGLTSPVWDRVGDDGSEPYECPCGAWFYARMPDRKECPTCAHYRHYLNYPRAPDEYDCAAPDSGEAVEWDGEGDCPCWSPKPDDNEVL